MSATKGDDDPLVKVWLSPTQIDLHELCERKYFFDRVLKMRAPGTSAQQLGIDVENHIEAALQNGARIPDDHAGKIAAAMLEHLPKRGTPGLVFQQDMRVRFRLDERVPDAFFGIVGKKDLVTADTVIDFKTTKDPRKWMKTAPLLMKCIQAQTYALDEMLKRHAVVMPLLWVYGRTKGAPKAFASPATMPHATAAQAIVRGRKAALRILDLKQPGYRVEDTTANTQACDAFGGCSHRAYCPSRAKTLGQFLGFEEEKKMGLKDKLSALVATDGQGALGAVAAIMAARQAPAGEVATAVGANGKPTLVFGPTACVACEGTGWNSKGGPCGPCKATAYTGGIEPGDPLADDTKPTILESAPPAEGVNPPDALPSPDDQPQPEVVEPVTDTGKRKRRTKAEIDAAKAEPKGMEVVDQLVADRQDAPVCPTLAEGGFTLLLDAAITKGGAASLDSLVQKAAVIGAKKAGVADYRLAEYGRGPGFVLLAFAELAATERIGAQHLTLTTRTPESQAVLGWLIDRASVVIKGVA